MKVNPRFEKNLINACIFFPHFRSVWSTPVPNETTSDVISYLVESHIIFKCAQMRSNNLCFGTACAAQCVWLISSSKCDLLKSSNSYKLNEVRGGFNMANSAPCNASAREDQLAKSWMQHHPAARFSSRRPKNRYADNLWRAIPDRFNIKARIYY